MSALMENGILVRLLIGIGVLVAATLTVLGLREADRRREGHAPRRHRGLCYLAAFGVFAATTTYAFLVPDPEVGFVTWILGFGITQGILAFWRQYR